MKIEDKQLLLQDLCARLPYGVKIAMPGLWDNKITIETLTEIFKGDDGLFRVNGNGHCIEYIKPYLFPLSSMTDEMLEELNANGFFKYRDTIANVSHLESKSGINEEIYTYIDIECISFLIKYFHSNHIDYKGFIETGLAIDATGLNIY